MATTINSYSVGLNLDASNYIRNSNLTRRETIQLKREIEKARTPAENYSRSIDRLDRALKAGAIDVKTYTRLIDEQQKKLSGADKAAKGHESSVVALSKRFLAIGAVVAGATRSVREFADMEAIKTQLEVLTGTATEAEHIFQQVRDIAAASPITFKGGADAVRTMLLFNVSSQDVVANLRMLGDITGGDTERMKSLALAFSQATAAGRLQGQDLRQMIDSGFNPLQVIAASTGETLDQVRERMATLGSGLDLMNDAFRMATSEGGRFNGMLDRMGTTTAGELAKMSSQFQILAADIGTELQPLISQLSGTLQEWAPRLEPVLWVIGKMADGLSLTLALARDVGNMFFGAFTADADGVFGTLEHPPLEQTNAFFDAWDKRNGAAKAGANQLGDAVQGAADKTGHLAGAMAGVTGELDSQIDKANQVASAEDKAAKAAQDRADAYRKATEQLDEAIVSETFKFAENRFGGAAAEQLQMAYDAMDAAQKKWLLENIEEGVGLDSLLSQAPNRDKLAELNTRQQINQTAERLEDIENNIGRAREAYEKRISKAQEEARKKAEQQRKDIAAGPGSGMGDPMAIMADQINARLANRVRIDPSQFMEKDAGQEELRELRKLQMEAQKERQKQTELLKQVAENKFQRIR